MMLGVTVRGSLESRYGPDGYQLIRAALDGFGQTANARIVALDDAQDMDEFGLPPSGGDSGSILFAVRNVRKFPGFDTLLLLGGDDIIPYWRLTNPVTDRGVDPDEEVLSDNPYGAASDKWEEYLAPEIPVGRLPNSGGGSAQDFVDLIELATAIRESRPLRSSSAAVVNTEWMEFSQAAAVAMPGPVDWHLAPGYRMDRGAAADTDRECLYFNLHGFSGKPEWKGYDRVRADYVIAVTPDAFERQNVSGTVVFAENCYGAQTAGRTPNNSCALRLVKEGAAFVGATGLAFGSHLTPDFFLEDADELAKFFWQDIRDGIGAGAALQRAKQQYLGETNAADTNSFKRKTLLQFVLLGEPG